MLGESRSEGWSNVFFLLTQSSCFQTLHSTAGYNLCMRMCTHTHTFLYTLESDWALLCHDTCRGIWLLLQNRCFHTSKRLLYTLLVVVSAPFLDSSPCMAQGSWSFSEWCRRQRTIEKRGVGCTTQLWLEFPLENMWKKGDKNSPNYSQNPCLTLAGGLQGWPHYHPFVKVTSHHLEVIFNS